ncbi:MAG: hypothetical protein N4A46_12070 [Schleiferiaceae bacterium]|jgi:hypothetical protein|nr:hypothetical protein [Schleiferiaceae bacterium]
MKKILLSLFVVCLFGTTDLSAQAQKYLNFGGVGTGLYASLEFPVGSLITVAPAAYTDWDFNRFVIAAKGNFYFDDLFSLTPDWDTYAGVNVGWRIEDNNGGANWGIHVGGRWFWSDRWGLNAEFGGGSGVNGGVGVTYKL